MKTTKKASAAKRLQKLIICKKRVDYKVAAELLQIPNFKRTGLINGDIIRPVYTSGSGRYTSNMDYTQQIQILLKSLGIDTKLENDSLRGGLTGNKLIILTKIL